MIVLTEARIFHRLSSLAIGKLLDKGYLLNNFDWDVKAQKYTLRIHGEDQKSVVAVGLITFSPKSDRIIVIDAITCEKSEFEITAKNGRSNASEFLNFICNWAQKLRETAAYK